MSEIKDGNLFIDNIVIDRLVDPSSVVEAEVTIGNGALTIRAADQDACRNDATPCDPPGLLANGAYCVSVELNPSWTDRTIQGPRCVHLQSVGVGREVFETSFISPGDPGDFTVEITLTALGTGEETTVTESVSVRDVGDPGNGNGDPGNGGGGDPGNGGGGDPGNGNGNGDPGEEDCPDGTIRRNGECVPAIAGIPRDWVIAGSLAGVGLGLLLIPDDD